MSNINVPIDVMTIIFLLRGALNRCSLIPHTFMIISQILVRWEPIFHFLLKSKKWKFQWLTIYRAKSKNITCHGFKLGEAVGRKISSGNSGGESTFVEFSPTTAKLKNSQKTAKIAVFWLFLPLAVVGENSTDVDSPPLLPDNIFRPNASPNLNPWQVIFLLFAL